jgi:hypothetical protein
LKVKKNNNNKKKKRMLADMYPEEENFSETVLAAVDLSIKDYYFTGDGDSYDKHYFVISVRTGSESYSVDRSYVDFVELDRRLRKSFPDSAVPTLPLDACNRLQQLITRESGILLDKKRQPGSANGSGGNPVKTFVSPNDMSTLPSDIRKTTAKNIFKIPVTSTEIMRQYIESLSYYLSDITCHHELLTSELLQVFLDEEIVSMFNDVIPPTLTVYDLLLLNSPVNNTIVHRIEEHMFQLPAESMLVWKFFTAQYDIGFSVEMEGMSRLPFTRYNAHEKPICGALETSLPTSVKLVWNNSYAKLYAKQLTWAVRAVHKEQFLEAKAQAIECYKEKKRFERQRKLFRLSAFRQATMISRVMHGDIIEEIFEENIETNLKFQNSKLEALEKSNDVLLKDLEKAEIRLNEVETVAENLQDSKARVSNTLSSSVEVLEELRSENADLHGAIIELQDSLREKEKKIADLEKYCQNSTQRFATIKNDVIELAVHLRDIFDLFRKEYYKGNDYFDSKDKKLQNILSNESDTAVKELLNQFVAELLDDAQDKNDAWFSIISQLGIIIEQTSKLSEV